MLDAPLLCHSALVRSITRATIVYFVASGLFAAVAVGLHLLGPRVAESVGSTTVGTVLVIVAWLLTAASALLLYHGMMRAAAEQDAAEERRAQARHEWEDREIPRPPTGTP